MTCGKGDRLKPVPPVGQGPSKVFSADDEKRMNCLFCGRKIRLWHKQFSSVVSANRYHWACFWDTVAKRETEKKEPPHSKAPPKLRNSLNFKQPHR